MILVTIVAVVRQHQIRSGLFLDLLEDPLDSGALVREETVPEILDPDALFARALEKQRRASPSLGPPLDPCREDHPVDLDGRRPAEEVEDQTAAPDLDVIGVGAETQDAEGCPGLPERAQSLHEKVIGAS